MAVSKRFALEQRSTLQGLGRTVAGALKQRVLGVSDRDPQELVGREVVLEVNPPSRRLAQAYAEHVGGDPRAYRASLPPHLFPQWTFDAASRLLSGMPYPLLRTVNGGCRLRVSGELPYGEPLQVRATMEEVDDNGRRAVLRQRLATGVKGEPAVVVAEVYAVVPLKRGGSSAAEKLRVAEGASRVEAWSLSGRAGLDFAVLTGDFNVIHWLKPAARAAGFESTILHGFATMARAYEGLMAHAGGGGAQMSTLDVKFTKPLVLPARVGLYEQDGRVWVAGGPSDYPYMTGEYRMA